jgi:hypothetical protein
MLQSQTLRALLMSVGIGLSLCACGGSGTAANSTQSPTVAAASVNGAVQTNVQIAQLIYTDTQRTPNGFYAESVPTFDGYVVTSHIKTLSINPSATLNYELCTDDYNQALSWSDTAHTVSNDAAALTGTDITDRYFEFDRLRTGTPNGYLRERVYKCSYLDRSTVDLDASSGDAGMLNARPLDAATLKQLAEYLWQFTHYNNYGNVVLSSAGATNGSTLTHTLTMATLSHAASSSDCDTITLLAWTHSLDSTTGELALNIATLGSFQTRESNGNVSLCTG